ncbi:MAG: hypothetical protein FWC95_07805 [Defluviitaleaceae bacterium]|nr:hypothetical protein [Defluviitaleaceae bacterium]
MGHEIILQPILGLTSHPIWQENEIVPGNTQIGFVNNQRRNGGIVFDIPNLSNYRILGLRLLVRLETQNTLTGTGTLITGGYTYSGVSDARIVGNFTQTGINNLARNQEFNIFSDRELLTENNRVAYYLQFNPQNVAGGFVNCNYSECRLVIAYEKFDPLPPGTLQPNGVNRNPNSEIYLSWSFNRNPQAPANEQTESILHYGTNEAWTAMPLRDSLNSHSFAPGTFTAGQTIEWRVQSVSNLGTSDFSETAFFTLAATPPFAPILVYPLNIAVDAREGAFLEWRFNSSYETTAGGHEVEYRIDGGDWRTINTEGISARTDPITTQTAVEWRVRSKGSLGDISPWSVTERFWTVGLPAMPAIVAVTGGNYPHVSFSAEGLISWEITFIDDLGNAVHATGERAFTGDFLYKSGKLFTNGNYTVSLRIRNVFGFLSDKASYAFTVNTPVLAPITLTATAGGMCGIRLAYKICDEISTDGYELIIHRTRLDLGVFTEIDKISINPDNGTVSYTDHTAAPYVLYSYFTRLINKNGNGFSDSNTAAASVDFDETLISPYNTPAEVKLRLLADDEAAKVEVNEIGTSFIQLVGKEKPYAQFGHARRRKLLLSYLCSIAETEKLKELILTAKPLMLRDRRFGTLCGSVTGALRMAAAPCGNTVVSFEFIETEGA